MAKKKRTTAKTSRTFALLRGKANSFFVWIILLIFVLAVLLAGNSASLSDLQDLEDASLAGPTAPAAPGGILCCDTGNGANCTPIFSKTFYFEDAGPYIPNQSKYPRGQYGLLRSSVQSDEDGQHMNFATKKNVGGRMLDLYYNDRGDDEDDPYSGCKKDQDWFARRKEDGGWQCYGVGHQVLVFLCSAENGATDEAANAKCTHNKSEALWDVYINLNYWEREGIPGFIANCDVPVVGSLNREDDKKVAGVSTANFPTKHSLQLETFSVTPGLTTIPTGSPAAVIKAPFLTPFCKPAIYLYPETTLPVNVQVFPSGPFTLTIPLYPRGGWSVLAHPSGDVTYNHQLYPYLYYEAKIPDSMIVLPEEGYVVAKEELATFLPGVLAKLGLIEKERKDFIDYWVKALPASPYFKIKILSQSTINSLAALSVSPQPKTTIRVALHFESIQTKQELKAPIIPPVYRDGYTLLEWGGMFKMDKDHEFTCLL